MYLTNQTDTPIIGFSGCPVELLNQLPGSSSEESKFLGMFTVDLGDVPGHENLALAFFLDINFADEDYIIPPKSTIDQFPDRLTEGDILSQQVGYWCTIYSKDLINSEVESLITRKYISEDVNESGAIQFGRMDRNPHWKGNDETPPEGPQGSPDFLFQVSENLILPADDAAPRQKIVDYFSADQVSYRKDHSYQIFAGNEIYFFSYQVGEKKVPFIVVQS
ncbi:hypothetical protein SAMN03159496_04106 [Rhizobium sp. NFR07]|uniref:hypothetical protein n=1 Tax=Rhizobium sp. NFR07 TaxID=1566262 RepID=UPI0008E9B9EE|nr:hypothetical protein [Rhizobium sp. NFR07]SFB48064.1 hypothetical protein SAMN03159496_04106 [Rhizobium sp. NFR07]